MRRPTPRHVLALLTAVLLLGAALRLSALRAVPPGLQHDEIFYAHDATTVLHGKLHLFFPENQGREPLFIYLLALSLSSLGQNALAIRLPAAFCGLLALALTYRWAGAAFGWRTAIYTILFMAIGFWPLWLSRTGLRVTTLAPLAALAGWLLTRAAQRPSVKRFVLAGLALGLCFYSYPAAYVLPLVVAGWLVALAFFARKQAARLWPGVLLIPGVAALCFVPLGLAIRASSIGYARAGNVAGPLTAALAGDTGPLLNGLLSVLLMWGVRGDPLWRYNIAGKPVFSPLLVTFFAAGVVTGLRLAFAPSQRRRAPAAWLLLAWIGLGVLPAALTDLPPAQLRSSAAMPAAFIALGLGLDALHGAALSWDRFRRIEHLWPLAVAGLAGLSLNGTVGDYFGTWAGNAEVQRVYRADLAAVAGVLRGQAGPVAVISTTEPNNLDPFIFDFTPHGDAPVRWFDGYFALLVPEEGPSRLFVTREPVPQPRLQSLFYDHLAVVDERVSANGALDYRQYGLPAPDAFLQQFPPPAEQGAWLADALAFPPDDPDGLRRPASLPVQFGDAVQLIGYEVAPSVRAGEWLELTLWWRVTRTVEGPQLYAVFAHLLDEEGQFAAGRDFLAVPAAGWREGDVFVQLHDVLTGPALPPGRYHLQIGMYNQEGVVRFPVTIDGQPAGDRLLLEPVTVQAP
ncbi:MAG: glycosyltransferase family 39 protein [Anaerolineae bacterium]|nr:glycosyltransferase family 39 protein [Anaerolineae bacterium]